MADMQLRVTKGRDLVVGQSWVAMQSMGTKTPGLLEFWPLLEISEHLSTPDTICFFSRHFHHINIQLDHLYLEAVEA